MPREHYYEIEVAAVGDGGEGSSLGTWRGLSKDTKTAKEQALAELWDARLDSGGARAKCTGGRAPRFLAATGWGHFFPDAPRREQQTRWMYDRGNGELVLAQILLGGRWVGLSKHDAADLLESLNDNELETGWQDLGVQASDQPPKWAKAFWEQKEGVRLAGEARDIARAVLAEIDDQAPSRQSSRKKAKGPAR